MEVGVVVVRLLDKIVVGVWLEELDELDESPIVMLKYAEVCEMFDPVSSNSQKKKIGESDSRSS